MKPEDKLRPFTKKEFEKIISIELKYYKKMRLLEKGNFNKSLKVLNKQEQEIAKMIDTELYNQLLKRVDKWREKETYKYGYCRMKNAFMLGYYRALIPILMKFYMMSGFENKNVLDPIKMNYYLKAKYPYLDSTLRNMHKIYKEFRKELEIEGMTLLMGFGEVSENQFRGFSHSTVVELIGRIKSIRAKPLKKARIDAILKAVKDNPKATQGEIAQIVKCSQQLVSKTLKSS